MAKKKRGVGRPVSNINVPKETMKFWKDNYQTGDFSRISAERKIGRPTLRKAWYANGCSQENIDKITAFYTDRLKNTSVIEEKIKLDSLSLG